MYYFYYRRCCGPKKKWAFAFKSKKRASKELLCNDGTPDNDIEGFVRNRNDLPDYVRYIEGDCGRHHRIYLDEFTRDVWGMG